jgi:hypothetical protein
MLELTLSSGNSITTAFRGPTDNEIHQVARAINIA